MRNQFELIRDETVTKKVRYVSFMGNFKRYDFAFMESEDPDKTAIIDLTTKRYAVLGKNDLSEGISIAHTFQLSEMEADEVRKFLEGVL
ncbi:SAV0927 family protein [Oceanobacillus halotolerans]|uniref:SAV0927 family protein n=1 Tax=Oceanobacillus halotolerans TaxID=2663380 RepID=UPI0013DB9D45|nr:SAV0927 family protein [Oceanobacillus halotolerans]